jgi:hypothetical protein
MARYYGDERHQFLSLRDCLSGVTSTQTLVQLL